MLIICSLSNEMSKSWKEKLWDILLYFNRYHFEN